MNWKWKVRWVNLPAEEPPCLLDIQRFSHLKTETEKALHSLSLPSSRYIPLNAYPWEEYLSPALPASFSVEDFLSRMGIPLVHLPLNRLYAIFSDHQTYRIDLDGRYAVKGVVFTDLCSVVENVPELIEEKWGKLIAPSSDYFCAIHYAKVQNGWVLHIPDNLEIPFPIQILYIKGPHPGATYLSGIIHLGKNSKATVIEHIYSYEAQSSPGMLSLLNEVFLEAGAELRFSTIQVLAPSVVYLSRRESKISRDARMYWNAGWFGGSLNRTITQNYLIGENSFAEDVQIFFGNKKQAFDLTSHLFHQSRHSKGEVLVKGALKDQSRGVFQGLIRIFPGAQNADAFQAAHMVLLNPGASADAIPSLEIEANDVRCTHSASTGQLDEDQLFYVMSRGLPQADARKILVQGFLEPAFSRIPSDMVRFALYHSLEQKWNE
ncbi:MAG: Fe-S cluster assembly protein SufD [bacterium JZ-2024 1]